MTSSIQLHNVSVDYPLNAKKSIKEIFTKQQPLTIKALSNITVTINQGERVGLIGFNGAGKSTLLKIMAKIYHPTQGKSSITGKICPLFEFATGFEMDLDGWTNIKIRAKLLGMSNQEIKMKLPEIAEFTGLGKFLDYPVRSYSSGMFIRLAFATSTAITPDILLLDEVVGAGDITFTQKAATRMAHFMDTGQILVFATHAPDLLKKFCERTLWLHKGSIQMDGPTEEVWNAYTQFNHNQTIEKSHETITA